MTLYDKKYRVETSRLKSWDYSANGFYFITICIENREFVFGEILNEEMQYSKLGEVANQYWLEIPTHFPFVKLDRFIVMPNHIHGIVIIDKPKETDPSLSVKTKEVETQNLASLRGQLSNSFGPQSRNISSIVRGFKIGVTKYTLENKIPFKWQSRFYDHIIRDREDLYNIQQYIINNPKNWSEDEFNTKKK